MMMPMPAGTPMRLPADVAGSMSRMQGLLQAAQPELQTAYAAHWLAARQASAAPAFQQLTGQMMTGLYGTTALSGLLRYALSGRATPEVMGGIIDQVNLIQHSYQGATSALNQFLQEPSAQELEGVRMMTRALTPLDRVYQQMEGPAQTVVNNVNWVPAGQIQGFPVERALIGSGADQQTAFSTPPALPDGPPPEEE
ncbi:MAG: hypothetical protein ACOY94_27920 [Bacillota bacterium]